MSKLIVWRFLTSNLRTNKADIKEINLKLIKVTPSYGTSDSLYPFNHSRWSFVQLDSNEIVATEKTHLYRKKSKKLKNKKQITKVLKKCPEESLLYYFYKIVSIISRLCRQRTDFKLFTQIKNKYCCKKL
jgi:hypothetical protein